MEPEPQAEKNNPLTHEKDAAAGNPGGRRPVKTALALYCCLFFSAWYLIRIFVFPAPPAQPDYLQLPVWLLPALLLLYHFREDVAVRPGELWKIRADALIVFVWAVPLFAVAVVLALYNGNMHLAVRFRPAELMETVVIAAVTEEVVFRGFILNVLLKTTEKRRAVLITTLIFTAVHIPIWLIRGVFGWLPGAVLTPVLVFSTGVVYSLAFIKSKNVWAPIALHMVWNLAACIFR